MCIAYDKSKRLKILEERGLDLADADEVFDGFYLTRRDERHSDVEERFISVGDLRGTIVIVVWTSRNDKRRIVTMWKANDRERQIYLRHQDRPG